MKPEKRDPAAAARALSDLGSRRTDPQGSYTGVPADPKEKPVQDADDL